MVPEVASVAATARSAQRPLPSSTLPAAAPTAQVRDPLLVLLDERTVRPGLAR